MIFKKFFSGEKQKNENIEKKDQIKESNNEENLNKKKENWFSKLKSKLKSSNSIVKNIFNLFEKSEIDYVQLEEMLLDFDIDYDLTQELLKKIKSKDKWGGGLNPESAKNLMKDFMIEIFKNNSRKFSLKEAIEKNEMTVLIFCGINGAGKTTTIAKIGSIYKNEKDNLDGMRLKPLFIACDIFRAAASEQLEFWAKKLDLEIFTGIQKDNNQNSSVEGEKKAKIDPASVAFSGIEYAKQNCHDLVMIDTSGRLHNNQNLMNELAKINRVIKKHNEDFANEVILVLDGTMGQNLLDQFEMFDKTIKISGIILTKLDGISKGGILLSLSNRFKVPIYFIGIGESVDDLNYFEPEEFIESLFE